MSELSGTHERRDKLNYALTNTTVEIDLYAEVLIESGIPIPEDLLEVVAL